MKLGFLVEGGSGERRVALVPATVAQHAKLGHSCVVETGAGGKAGFPDAAYEEAGAEIAKDAAAVTCPVKNRPKFAPASITAR